MASVSPSNATFQGRAGGWPGQPTFTDPTQVYIVSPLTVNWKSGALIYNFASGFQLPQEGQLSRTFFVTLSDPNRSGTAQIFIDTDAARWSQDAETFAPVGIVQTYVPPSGFVAPGSGGGAGAVQQVQVVVTSAQIKALSATPVQLLAAPGAGKMYQIVSVCFQYKFGTTSYVQTVTAMQIAVGYQGIFGFGHVMSGSIGESGFIDQTSSQIFFPAATNNASEALTAYVNAALVVSAFNNAGGGNSDATTGDGTLTVTVDYSVLNVT